MVLGYLRNATRGTARTFVVAGLLLAALFGGALLVKAAVQPPTNWFVYYPLNNSAQSFGTLNEAFEAYWQWEGAQAPANYTKRCTRYAPKAEYYSIMYSSRYVKWVNGELIRNCSPWPDVGGSSNDTVYGIIGDIACNQNSADPRCHIPFSPAVEKNAGAPNGSNPFSTGGVCCGNPINVGTGNKFQVEQDFEVPGSPWLSLKRYYNSQSSRALGVSMGLRWRHSFDYSIEFRGSGGYALQRPDGSVRRFGGTVDTPQDEHAIFDYELDSSANISSYYLIDTDGTIERYNPQGLITRIELPTGGWLNFEYGGTTRRLSRVVDHNGRALGFAYNSSGRVQSITLPGGSVYQYGYDAGGLLTSRTAPGNASRTYVYDETSASAAPVLRGLLTRINDEQGQVVGRYAYDSRGRAVSTEGGAGANRFVVSYGTDSATFTLPGQAQRSFVFGTYLSFPKATTATTSCSGTGCTAVGTKTSSYDSQGNQIATVHVDGTKTCRSFDTGRNLPVRVVEGLSAGAECGSALGSPPAGTRTTTIEWHADRVLPLRLATPQLLTAYSYDAAGRVLSVSRVSTTSASGAEGFNAAAVGTARATSFAYDGFGRVLAIDGPRTDVNDVYTYSYDSAGNLVSAVSPTGKTTSFGSYDGDGRPRQMTDPSGVTTVLAYNARGQLLSSTRAGLTTSFVYSPAGSLVSQSLPDGTVLSYGYDAAGRLTSATDERGNKYQRVLNGAGSLLQASVLNSAGAVVTQLSQTVDPLERVLSMTGAHNVSPNALLLKP